VKYDLFLQNVLFDEEKSEIIEEDHIPIVITQTSKKYHTLSISAIT
jgi:hypothetical protein